MMFAQKDFENEDVLRKQLMAHLSTVGDGAPRDSPVWFLWDDSFLCWGGRVLSACFRLMECLF